MMAAAMSSRTGAGLRSPKHASYLRALHVVTVRVPVMLELLGSCVCVTALDVRVEKVRGECGDLQYGTGIVCQFHHVS